MIINATTFNAEENTKYAKPKINKSGGKSVGILNSDSNKSLYLSTPLMLTWGVNEFVDDSSGRRTYDMSLQFPKEEYKTEAAEQMLQAMLAMSAATALAGCDFVELTGARFDHFFDSLN